MTAVYQLEPAVASDPDGDFVVVWSTGLPGFGADIYGQRYASDGSAVGTEFQVNTYTSDFQIASSVAVDADGDFVVVWHSGLFGFDFDVQGQRYASNGSAVGVEFQVNTSTTNGQNYASVAAEINGDFVVVWQSDVSSGSDTDGSSIQGQRYAGPAPTTVVPSLSPSALLALVVLVLGAGALILRGRLSLPS